MRSRQDLRAVRQLAEVGLPWREISRRTGVPPTTVHRRLNGSPPGFGHPTSMPPAAYCHLLGLYLGDGHIAAFPRAHCLRIYLDRQYPAIVAGCVASMRAVAPHNRVAVHGKPGCVVVQSYSQMWPRLFPQHGRGPKHLRVIELEDWQRALTCTHARELVRGLIESDGSRREAVAALDTFVGPKR